MNAAPASVVSTPPVIPQIAAVPHDQSPPESSPREADRFRQRAVLLEFLKFRVLAAEDGFFEQQDPSERRSWLQALHPQALQLSDDDLAEVWQQARDLYGCH